MQMTTFGEVGAADNLVDSDGRNRYDIYCPSCKGFVLRKSHAARYPNPPPSTSDTHTTESIQLPSILKTEQGMQSTPAFFWKVPDMMHFENIGFSRPLEGEGSHQTTEDGTGRTGSAASTLLPLTIDRYLSCADCDLGPLGCSGVISASSHDVIPKETDVDDDVQAVAVAVAVSVPSSKLLLLAADRVRYNMSN
ncbi:hypothetical protein BSLG_007487 [Batrachochytrium salamandrivorans]|nr:hypothetical protein BSLG_007487 [Batrachochytrium salamandrivorans]